MAADTSGTLSSSSLSCSLLCSTNLCSIKASWNVGYIVTHCDICTPQSHSDKKFHIAERHLEKKRIRLHVCLLLSRSFCIFLSAYPIPCLWTDVWNTAALSAGSAPRYFLTRSRCFARTSSELRRARDRIRYEIDSEARRAKGSSKIAIKMY